MSVITVDGREVMVNDVGEIVALIGKKYELPTYVQDELIESDRLNKERFSFLNH